MLAVGDSDPKDDHTQQYGGAAPGAGPNTAYWRT